MEKNTMRRRLLRTVAGCMILSLSTLAYSAQQNILVLGDSLSAEYGVERGSGWVSLLKQRIDADKLPYQVVNASISGETTSGGKSRLPALLKQHAPAVVIIELGANDALRGLSMNATRNNMASMISASQQATSRVLLVGMQIPPNYGRTYTTQFTAMFSDMAKQYRTALAPFLMAGFADKMDYFQPDRIHPNEQAQPLMLDNVWSHLRPLLK